MSPPAAPVHRFEVHTADHTADPHAAAVVRDAKAALGLAPTFVIARQVYLIQANLTPAQADLVATALLADPVTERVRPGAAPVETIDGSPAHLIELHPLPGVMDPAALSVELAIRDLLALAPAAPLAVTTGKRYDIAGVTQDQARTIATRLLANPVIQRVSFEPYTPAHFPVAAAHDHAPRSITLTTLTDEELTKLSRAAHLFLSLDEMRAVQAHYRALAREPREIELETLAQTWSEHCVHKTLKSSVRYQDSVATSTINWHNRPGVTVEPTGTIRIDNLLKSTVAAATFELIAEGLDWTLSVFKDNSGVIAFDQQHAVCIKVETHNRPSAIEPYGGAATGAGGCIRDVIGTGLGAKPIASTDVFCVAPPTTSASTLPPGTLHPRRILTQVVAGVRDYGNRMGIPTVAGAVAFDPRYVGNPLVFCGCVGLLPRHLTSGAASPGDRIIALGGRTGRDGVHGATFSSAQLEQNAADEFGHAVQIGNAITEKQLLDAILRARDFALPSSHANDHSSGQTKPLYTAITDCGAGGFSSAVGEMGATLGAYVTLENAPLKYAGLSPTEVWISEAQERMILAVPPQNLAALTRICQQEGVDIADLGHFGTPGAELILTHNSVEVGRLPMALLHDGIPMPTRDARWSPDLAPLSTPPASTPSHHPKDTLLALLADPNIASKHWIIRQYDHEVQGRTVIKPLVGPAGRGPADAAVIEPIPGSDRGIALASGLATAVGDPALNGDPYLMALSAVDEAVRNAVCVGGDPDYCAILDNFSWPSCTKEGNMAALVRACVGCYDAAKAYRTPFVSGKDSLNNQLQYTDSHGVQRLIEIPFTLLITSMAIVPSVAAAITSDAKAPGSTLLLVGPFKPELGASHAQRLLALPTNLPIPRVDLAAGPKTARAVAKLIARGLISSAHDVSDGGVLTAVAEMLIGATAPLRAGQPSIGASVNTAAIARSTAPEDLFAAAFAECPSCYVLEVAPHNLAAARAALDATNVDHRTLGQLNASGVLTDDSLKLSAVAGDLAGTWLAPLDW